MNLFTESERIFKEISKHFNKSLKKLKRFASLQQFAKFRIRIIFIHKD